MLFFCGSKRTKKNGKQNGKQRYKCNDCGRRFDGGERLNYAKLWRLYSERKQSKTELLNASNAVIAQSLVI